MAEHEIELARLGPKLGEPWRHGSRAPGHTQLKIADFVLLHLFAFEMDRQTDNNAQTDV